MTRKERTRVESMLNDLRKAWKAYPHQRPAIEWTAGQLKTLLA